MAVLERSELQASPLADLHAIADQLGIDGYRRLRKPELIDAILAKGEPKQNGGGQPEIKPARGFARRFRFCDQLTHRDDHEYICFFCSTAATPNTRYPEVLIPGHC